MKYLITLQWNGKIVLDGKCTAVVAHENLRAMYNSFSGKEKSGVAEYWAKHVPSLVDLANVPLGTQFKGGFGDNTGHFDYLLTRMVEE